MSTTPNHFDSLRRLLAIKRHEQPPPRYFNEFSGRVIARIQAGEQGKASASSWFQRWIGESVWWQRLSAGLEAKPAFAGAFGAGVFALLISGIVYSENTPISLTSELMAGDTYSSLDSGALPPADGLGQQPLFASSSTNPVAPTSGSLFDQYQARFPIQSQRAGLLIPTGN
jgi:hypothetical protein